MKANHLSKKQERTPDQQAQLQPELLKTGLAIAQKQEAARRARQEKNQAQQAQEAIASAALNPTQKAKYEIDKALRMQKKEQKRAMFNSRRGQQRSE